jgi:hypothetical protein
VTAGRAVPGGGGATGGGAAGGRPLLPRGGPAHATNNGSSNGSGSGREGSPARPGGGTGGLTSATLLAQARARQAPTSSSRHQSGDSGAGGSTGSGQRDTEEADLLAARIVSFLDAQKPGRDADSATVVAAFRTAVPQDGMPLFRQLLHEVRLSPRRHEGGLQSECAVT